MQKGKTQDIVPFINSNYRRVQYERWAAHNLQVALDAERKYWHEEDRPCLMVRIMGIVLMLGTVLGGTICMDVLIGLSEYGHKKEQPIGVSCSSETKCDYENFVSCLL